MPFRQCLLCLSFALAASIASADERYVWRNVKVGGGGFTPNIVFSDVEKGLAYLRTDIGGAYRWESTHWIPLEDGIASRDYMEVESIAPDPRDADTVYLAAGTRNDAAILRSHDRGAHWQIFPTQFRMGGNDEGRGLGERLAVDPSNTSLLYFGSRNDGLQRSADSGESWSKAGSFPLPGSGFQEWGKPANAGLSFVIFVPQGEAKGAPTRTILVGNADPGAHHLFRSNDAGASWQAVAGEPRADLLPVRAALDARGIVYLTYCDSVGPNGVKDGAVFKLDLRSGKWEDVTPDKDPKHPSGYMAIALDRRDPGTVMVATLNRYHPHDTIWRSRDGGATWSSLLEISHRDVSASPFLIWGHQWGNIEADFGWWIAGLAIDPFSSGHVAYTTGATIYATDDMAATTIAWKPWVEGMEETAVLNVISPSAGPHLLSGFGDIGGFAHVNLDLSPPEMFTNPVFTNTNTIDYAGMAPNVVVRSGTPAPRAKEYAPTLAYSLDSGKSWSPLSVPPLKGRNAQGEIETRRYDDTGDAAIAVSADGSSFIAMTPVPLLTRDRGKNWMPIASLPTWSHAVADRVNPGRFYAVDFQRNIVLESTDCGANFTALATTGLMLDPHADWPTWREAQWPLMATPGIEGDLWFRTAGGRLFHSVDGGSSFKEAVTYMNIEALGFGMAPPGKTYPALFSFGWKGPIRGIRRSDDIGKTWLRINDDEHQYGRRFRSIAGDPRIFGRVYLGTDGRGVFYGDPAH